MPDILGVIRSKAAYSYFLLAVIWAVVAVVDGSAFLGWPVLLFAVSGALLMARPGDRLTWAWTMSSLLFGFLLAAYQVYSAAVLLPTAFYSIAAISAAAFVLFGAAHVFVFYAGLTGEKQA